MVLKALCVGISLKGILDLSRRITLHVTRMAEAFIRERRAIGRPVPEDVWQLIPATWK